MTLTITLAAAEAQTFNADFYTVAATVIPVLFLALTLQSDFWRTLLRGMLEHRIKQPPLTLRGVVRRPVTSEELLRRLGTYATNNKDYAAFQIAWFTFIALFVGEILALVSLAYGHAVLGAAWLVLTLAIFLTVTAGIAAAIPFATAFRNANRRACRPSRHRPGLQRPVRPRPTPRRRRPTRPAQSPRPRRSNPT